MTGDAAGELLKPLVYVGDLVASTSIGRILLVVVGAVLLVPSAAIVAALMSGPPSAGGPGAVVFFLPLVFSLLCLVVAFRGHFRTRAKRRRRERGGRLKLSFLIGIGVSLIGAVVWIFILSPKMKDRAS